MGIVEISIQKEYEKNPDITPNNIARIRTWLNEQPHLPYAHITDFDIFLAYYCCNRDEKQTKRVIDLNFTLRTLFTFYRNRKVDQPLEVACHTWLMTPLSTPTLKGYRAIYCHLLDPDTKKFVYSDVIRVAVDFPWIPSSDPDLVTMGPTWKYTLPNKTEKFQIGQQLAEAFVMIFDQWQNEEGTVPGVVLIVNMENVTLGHIAGINLTVAQQYFYFLQEAMFIHLKEFHFINAPNFVDKMLSMVKPFMKEEMLEMLKVHPLGSNTLDQYLPRAALPKEAGGENKDCVKLRDETWAKIKANVTFFKEESKKRVDESMRPGGPVTMSTFFPSMEGSFKKLTID